MKFVHTADWHLGKIIHGRSLLEDQRYVLLQMFERIHQEGIQLCIIAGDIYDRSIPGVDAVKVLNEVLEKAIFEYRIQVIIIAGNHDSGERLHFGSALMNHNLIRVEGILKPTMAYIEVSDSHGKIHIHCLPYFKPAQVQVMFNLEETLSFDDAMKIYLAHHHFQAGIRHVLVTHHFLVGIAASIESNSELPLSVGGSYHISYEHVKMFNYVACGHLHTPQKVGENHIRYSGSILKYSENEVSHTKGFTVVDLNLETVQTYHVPLKPLRDLRILQGSMRELVAMEPSEDYVIVYCTDVSVISNAMDSIRTIFPHALKFMYTKDLIHETTRQSSLHAAVLHTSELDVFEHFFKDMKAIPITESQRNLMISLFEEARGEES